MAGGGLLALLDDISVLLDDIATMTKVAATKTAGVTGDDLAVSADQLNGIAAARELPVVKAVAIGSLKNKAILVPATMGISALSVVTGLPLIPAVLVLGGTYLCYEGVEKIVEGFEKALHPKNKKDEKRHEAMLKAAAHDTMEKFEKEKIKGAIRTDMVLSAEIMVIALGTLTALPLITQALVLTGVGVAMTGLVYGLVAGIVKMDDVGLWMAKKEGDSLLSKTVRGAGRGLVNAASPLMKGLSIVGTIAMFMVGGDILLHNIPMLSHLSHGIAAGLPSLAVSVTAGVAWGAAAVLGMKPVHKIISVSKKLFSGLSKKAAAKPESPSLSPEGPSNSNISRKKKDELTSAMNAAAAVQAPVSENIQPKNSALPSIKGNDATHGIS